MAKTLKSCGFNKTSLDMSMVLFDEIIEMLNGTMFRMQVLLQSLKKANPVYKLWLSFKKF
ncbi:hypothetical protein ABE43_22245 [Bacillus thuringiensis]|nr:hypothetical protein [Bacillus thuringiensis]